MAHRREWLLYCVFAAAVAAAAGWPGTAQEAAQDAAVATDTPAAAIASLQQALVAASGRTSGSTVEQRYRALEPVIVATHDLPYIAQFALRRQWPSLTEDDRERFIAAFQRLSVMTYAARFGNVASDAFRPLEIGEPDGNARVQVATGIKREGQADVSLEYLLQQDAQRWRIINIIADGVSDLALKRAEYQRVFADGGIEGLIAELEQQTERLTSG
jgi:phospholipid transport system substrate-binding protein